MPPPAYHPIPDVAHFATPWQSLDPKHPSSYREDGSLKGPGWLGPYKNKKGQMVTEYSIGVPIDGKEMDIPSLVPGLTPEEINQVVSGRVPESVLQKAVEHAEGKVKNKQSVWATEDDYKSFMTPPKEPSFDPEGKDYDMNSALAAGLKADETGHWPSRDPQSGLLLKGRGHETFHKTLEGEANAGMRVYQGKDGRWYSK
jgi:hypothetical protein